MKIYCRDLYEIKWENSFSEFNNKSIHIWLVETINEEKKLSTFRKTFTEDENKRADRFAFEKDRNQFITAHGSLRKILSKYISVDPNQIQFRETKNKKPFVVSPITSLKFNISHSENKILVAVSDNEIGADIELIKPGFEFKDLIKTYFSVKEQNSILHSQNPNETFYKFWTRKESVLKATGIGIVGNLKEIEIFSAENDTLFSENYFIYSFEVDNFTASIAVQENIFELKFFKF